MKYIKLFEDVDEFGNEMTIRNEIKDVFQEYADKYLLRYAGYSRYMPGSKIKWSDEDMIPQYELNGLEDNGNFSWVKLLCVVWFEDSSEFLIDMREFVSRLQSIGYDAKIEGITNFTDVFKCYEIKIEV